MDYSYVRDVFKFEDAAYASLGGIVLGICTSLHYMGYGKLTGISGMVENVISPKSENIQVVFLCGCYAVGFLYILASGKPLETLPMPSYILIIAGFCVGFGSRLGCGCTSGHGICGLARISKRSIIGVAAFMTTGVLTANLVYGPVAGGPETDLNSNWFVSNNYGGAVLLVVSFLVAMREFTLESLHYWVFGGLFGLGLSISGMVNNHIVIAFLNFNKDWDPALMFVLCFAVGVFGVTYWCSVYFKVEKPLFATVFKLPSKTDLDWPLVLGELIFGVGWGLAGLCPGPVVAVLSVPAVGTIFLPSLWLGMKTVALLNDSTNNSLISASTKTPAAADANQVEVSTALNKSDAYSA